MLLASNDVQFRDIHSSIDFANPCSRLKPFNSSVKHFGFSLILFLCQKKLLQPYINKNLLYCMFPTLPYTSYCSRALISRAVSKAGISILLPKHHLALPITQSLASNHRCTDTIIYAIRWTAPPLPTIFSAFLLQTRPLAGAVQKSSPNVWFQTPCYQQIKNKQQGTQLCIASLNYISVATWRL